MGLKQALFAQRTLQEAVCLGPQSSWRGLGEARAGGKGRQNWKLGRPWVSNATTPWLVWALEDGSELSSQAQRREQVWVGTADVSEGPAGPVSPGCCERKVPLPRPSPVSYAHLLFHGIGIMRVIMGIN